MSVSRTSSRAVLKESCLRLACYPTVNDEPEIMQPGDCFTIEVRRLLYLGVTWSSNSALFSLLLFRATIRLE